MNTHATGHIDHATPRPRVAFSARLSLGACLGFAVLAVLAVLLVGMNLARQSTRETAELVSRVERRFEPLLAVARNLEVALADFDRAVSDLQHTGANEERATVDATSLRLLTILQDYSRLASTASMVIGPGMTERLESFRTDGLALAELHRMRQQEVRRALAALDALALRTTRAAGGAELGPQLMVRKSLTDLARAAATLRAAVTAEFATASAPAISAANREERAFGALLRKHAAELTQSPGRAWLELGREDLAVATRSRMATLRLEASIEEKRTDFAAAARDLSSKVDSELKQPAWAALSAAAGKARVTAQKAELHLQRVAAAVLAVVLVIAILIAYGILGPARRLLQGTRRLTRGDLATRVPRGGVRELDELAAAFNEMTEALANTRHALQYERSALEDRVAERTRQLRHLAHHDPLTDLPNRRELATHLAAAIARARADSISCAVFYMDIDNFKTMNDSLGHEFGDRVLREIGARLQEICEPNGFLARLGGDEFTIVLEGMASAVAAEAHCETITRAFQQPLQVGDREVLVSLSVGIALSPEHGDTAEALLRAADAALFQAKERGRNRFSVYRPELLAAASHRFHTEQGLRRALESNDLLLHFQPEVSLREMKTTVVEALLRWRQPDGRIAAANEFMGIAEQSGLILDLSAWVLRHAIESVQFLRRTGWTDARVAINVSAQQFLTGRFVSSVEKVLSETGVPASCLEIELTETALQTGQLAVDALLALRKLGVAVALDDFGAGYSSLRSLDELPLTRVKLDRSLMKDVDSNATAAAITQSIVRLCRSLGLEVTTEGIERTGQLDFLAGCGDVQVQGYLIAHPAPIEDVAWFVADTRLRVSSVWSDPAPGRSAAQTEQESASVAFLQPRRR
jgi:diguanylate cyclase (GGDEF)-like protein